MNILLNSASGWTEYSNSVQINVLNEVVKVTKLGFIVSYVYHIYPEFDHHNILFNVFF